MKVRQLVRMAGTPAVTYGCEVMGFSDAHLALARGAIATAAAPESGGEKPSLVLYALDAGGSTLDPAFDCHIAPIKAYALAHWQRWRPATELHETFDAAVHRLRTATRSPWDVVSGPISALVATVWRLGWRIRSPYQFVTDLGSEINLLIDSPADVAQLARTSVRRWQLAQVVRLFPDLLPVEDDITHVVRPEPRLQLNEFYCQPAYNKANDLTARLPQSVVDCGPVLGRLLHGKRARSRMVQEWSPAHRPWLLSLVSGGQWPQTRVAQAAGDDTTIHCQLCLDQPGTLDHRRCCPATLPEDGWPSMGPQEQRFVDGLKAPRRRLMLSQGLFLMKAQVTRQRPNGWFRWLKQPVGDVPDSAVWYVDGSLLDGPSRLLGATGYSIVVVAQDGQLLGCAHGAPPRWVTTAGAAEAYATYKVLTLTPFVPHIVTDCLGVLQTLQRGAAAATAANRVNARLWSLIGGCLDGTTWHDAASLVTWMPAHGSKSVIGAALKSNNEAVTATDWRANRLADALAKAAAARFRVAHGTQLAINTAFRAYEQAAAVAGLVTQAANNYCVSATAQDGTYVHRRLRDALPPAARPSAKKTAQPAQLPPTSACSTTTAPDPASTTTLAAPSTAPLAPAPSTSATSSSTRAARAERAACQRTDALRDARFVQAWHREMATRPALAAQGSSAQERLEALRLRVRLKSAQAQCLL